MSARSLSNISAAILLFLGVVAVGIRFSSRAVQQEAEEVSRWRLTYDIDIEVPPVDDRPIQELALALPFETANARITEQAFSQARLHWTTYPLAGHRTRERKVSTRQPGRYEVGATFEFSLNPEPRWETSARLEPLLPDDRARFLREELHLPVRSGAGATGSVQRIIQEGPGREATVGQRLQWLFDFCMDLESVSGSDPEMALHNEVSNVLTSTAEEGLQATPLGRARTFVTLCRASQIPARLVTGFELRQQDNAKPHVWAEVYQENRWLPFDPEYGYARQMPYTFVPVRRGGDSVVRIPRESGLVTIAAEKYSIERLSPPPHVLSTGTRRPSQIFDLTRLPFSMHNVMSLILLLPFGALITAFFRNIVGLMTFGTFAPALLAMSFIYSDWGTGILILAVVVTAGLFGRAFLDRLHLLMVPRLSIILTTIILCVVYGVSLLDYIELTPGADAVLLPLVILTTLIERFHVTREEDGPAYAGQLALGTLIVAAFCYVMLRWDDVGHFILIYPEAHLFTLAAFVIIGRYSGYRISELLRFRDMVNPKESGS